MGITEERIERIKKHAETMEGFARAAVNVSSELDAVLRDNQQMERQIERLNEANDSLRERLDRGENHDGFMKLPLDANGEPIRIGDVLYSSGSEYHVVAITVKAEETLVGVHAVDGVFLPSINPKYLSRKNPEPLEPEPADSWDMLEKDAMRSACELSGSGHLRCGDCEWGKEDIGCQAMARLEILKRAKKLAGIEEAQR